MDLSPRVLQGIYQDMLGEFEANNKDPVYLQKTIDNGSLSANL